MPAEDGAHSEHLLAFDRSTILSLSAILLLALLETLTSMSTSQQFRQFRRCQIPLALSSKACSITHWVKAWTKSKRQQDLAMGAVACLMLVLWLGTIALAASPQLHRLLHPGSQNADHVCLIPQLQLHPFLVTVAPPAAPTPSFGPASAVHPLDFQFIPACDHRLALSRAPPSVSSSATVVG